MSYALRFDVIVAGLGAMGSQTLAHLARRGVNAVGFDRFTPPHDQGSSHGKSRIIREAYFEDPIYVPLVRRAYECWAELEAETGTTLFRRTGGLCYGPPDGELVTGARRSAELHGVAHESLDAAALRRRFPAFVVEDDWVGLLESRAGMLDPERAIAAALDVARRHGALVRTGEPVLRWRQDGDGVVVDTPQGTYHAAQLVLSAGMWIGELVRGLGLPITVQRNALYWFEPRRDSALFAPERFPVFLGDLAPGLMLYGFPDTGDCVKVALHHFGPAVTPDAVDRTVGAAEIDHLRGVLQRYLPAANGALRETGVCTYTNVPDEQFIIDRHPEASRVWVASPCSGHGFKFSSAIGEVLADLVTTGRSRFDLTPFSIGRFSAGRSS
ncbi:MAG: N-methyl-L-tryptophan oxidase [Gemmatimonadetes bacterium]|nr:N-methyl-L-tryptophan oxidase [Gemmatimonadota bacterium]